MAKIGLNPFMALPTDETTHILAKQRPNLRAIKTTGYGWLDCGVMAVPGLSNNAWRTRFTATDTKTGTTVNGTVCSGFVWGHTIKMR